MNLKNINWSKYKKYIVVVIIILFILLFGGIYLVHASSVVEETTEEETIKKEELKEDVNVIEENVAETILVDIKGAVLNPGVYQLKLGCSVQDAINMAGGLLEDANTSVINLSKRLTDEMVIIIYTNQEIELWNKDNEVVTEFVYVEIPCECPDTMNEACVEVKEDVSTEKETLVSINTASKEELMTLPSIGESKAEAIIKYREENGKFIEISDIMNVSGIGKSVFEKIKDQITI